MLLYSQGYDGYLFRRREDAFNPPNHVGTHTYGIGWVPTHVWGGRYASAGLFSCPSEPLSAANMEVMEDWQNETANASTFRVSYCYWNGENTGGANQMEYPGIYIDGDVSNGEYPIRLMQKEASTICIVSDYFGGNNSGGEYGDRRQGMARHKDKDGYGAGGNHIYLDGHAVWKPWTNMGPINSNASYWWGGGDWARGKTQQ